MADADKTPAKKDKKSLLPIILIAVVLLGAGGGGGWWFFIHKPAVEAAAEDAANDDQDRGEHGDAGGKAGGKRGKAKKDKRDKKKGEAEGIVTFEPFVVNLADKGATRFLRANVRLVVGGAEEAEHLQKDQVVVSKLRSAILDLLSEQTADQMVTADGKAALKLAIAERVSETLDEVEVSDVLFADFVVQF